MNQYDQSPPDQRGKVGGHEGDNHRPREIEGAFSGPTKGQTALHVAAAAGNMADVRRLLDSRRIDINSVDSNGWQPLHEAVHSGHLSVVKMLLSRGADVASKTNNGGTALWWAKGTFNSNHPVVRYLQSIGAPDSDEM